MSDQLSLSAFASALALVALCLHAPSIDARGGGAEPGAAVAAMADPDGPAIARLIR